MLSYLRSQDLNRDVNLDSKTMRLYRGANQGSYCSLIGISAVINIAMSYCETVVVWWSLYNCNRCMFSEILSVQILSVLEANRSFEKSALTCNGKTKVIMVVPTVVE